MITTIQPARALRQRDIAQLTDDELVRLNYDAMIDVVISSEMPVPNAESIRSFEGDTMYRLVHMAREHCRRAVT